MNQEDLKRLGLMNIDINLNESYETTDSSGNHIIYLKLNKDKHPICPICASDVVRTKGYKPISIKYATTFENNIKIILYRQVYICHSGHYFKQNNPKKTEAFCKHSSILIFNSILNYK